jgi:transposase
VRATGLTNDTTLLLGLDGLAVQRVEVDDTGTAVVHLNTGDPYAARCPSCAQVSCSPKQRVTTHPRDLPHGGRGVRLLWHKKRWRCGNADCAKASFTESVPVLPGRARLTSRLRAHAGAAVGDRGATVTQAAREHGLSWPTVMDAVTAHAQAMLPDEPAPVDALGVDETRRGRPKFRVNPDTNEWEMIVDRWHVGFVDINGGQGLLGQVEGRTKSTVVDWLSARGKAWCEQVRYVAIDMCSVFAAGIALALPHATIVVDHFHVVQLANQTLDEIRCRTTTQLRARRGRKGDGEWDVRNLLTRNRENLSERRFAQMWNTLIDLGKPGEDILAAYIAKENLRELLALARTGPDRHRISQRLYAFYDSCATAGIGELERLAATVERWWPTIEAFIKTSITNAKSEGVNRVVKLVARNAFGFRNPTNQRLRTRCVTTRRARGHLKPA